MLPSNVDPLDLQEEDELAHIIDGIFLILQMENFSFKKLALKIIIVQSPALSLRWSKRRGNQLSTSSCPQSSATLASQQRISPI